MLCYGSRENQCSGRPFLTASHEDPFPSRGTYPIYWQTVSLPGTIQVRMAREISKSEQRQSMKGRWEDIGVLEGLGKRGILKEEKKNNPVEN